MSAEDLERADPKGLEVPITPEEGVAMYRTFLAYRKALSELVEAIDSGKGFENMKPYWLAARELLAKENDDDQ